MQHAKRYRAETSNDEIIVVENPGRRHHEDSKYSIPRKFIDS